MVVLKICCSSIMITFVCRVVECNDLPVTNGACNPYAVVTVMTGKVDSRRDVRRTGVRKKTICPQFDETFFFDVSSLLSSTFIIKIENVCSLVHYVI